MDCLGDDFDLDGGQQIEPLARDIQAFGPHLDLLNRFFAGDIEHRPDVLCDRARYLEQQRRFADAWFTADQNERTRDQTAAQHAIHLAIADGDTFLDEWLDLRQHDGNMCSLREGHGCPDSPADVAGQGSVQAFPPLLPAYSRRHSRGICPPICFVRHHIAGRHILCVF